MPMQDLLTVRCNYMPRYIPTVKQESGWPKFAKRMIGHHPVADMGMQAQKAATKIAGLLAPYAGWESRGLLRGELAAASAKSGAREDSECSLLYFLLVLYVAP